MILELPNGFITFTMKLKHVEIYVIYLITFWVLALFESTLVYNLLCFLCEYHIECVFFYVFTNDLIYANLRMWRVLCRVVCI
jgi:hypothetical protein